jgi:hypothetical protein
MRHATGIATTAPGVLVLLTASGPARAQCSFGCNKYVQGQCVEYRTCSPDSSTPSHPSASDGAIAFGRTSKAWGDSFRWGSRAKAERVAMQKCGEHGNDCEVMVWFSRKCGAVVSGEGTNAFWGLGNNDRQARADAQSKCENGDDKNCEVKVSRCSYCRLEKPSGVPGAAAGRTQRGGIESRLGADPE